MEGVPSRLFAALLRVVCNLLPWLFCTALRRGCSSSASAHASVSYSPLAIVEASVVRAQEVSSVDGSRHNSIYNPSSRSGTAYSRGAALPPCWLGTRVTFCINTFALVSCE